MTTQTQDGLATLTKPQLEVTIQTKTPFPDSHVQPTDKKLDFEINLSHYPTHIRIARVQEVGSQIQIFLIPSQNYSGKEGIRKIYEQSFNWENWLKYIQENAKKQGYPVTGYYLINYVTNDEHYLGQSSSEVTSHLVEAGYDSY